jgi:Zn-dependent protease
MRLIVADVRSTSTDGIAAGHYFTVAQNYLDLFGAEMDVRIAGGPVYGDRFGNKLIRLPHDYIVGSSAVRNKRAVFQNVRALLREAQDDVIVLQCSAVATAYLGLALFNILPIPPLDGYHLVNDLLFKGKLQLKRQAFVIAQIVLIFIFMSGALDQFLSKAIFAVYEFFLKGFLAVFGLS